jgi:hypothetical protein
VSRIIRQRNCRPYTSEAIAQAALLRYVSLTPLFIWHISLNQFAEKTEKKREEKKRKASLPLKRT